MIPVIAPGIAAKGHSKMIRFMIVCFLILGWAFYELSGGSEFEPERRAEADPVEVPVADAAPAAAVELALVEPVQAESGESIQDRLATALVTPSVTEIRLDGAVIEAATQEIIAEIVPEAVVEAVAEVAPVIEPEPTQVDLRQVAGSRVNMRSGPSTDFAVLTTLNGGTATEVIDRNEDGWVLVRVQETGQEGWMAERLLEPING